MKAVARPARSSQLRLAPLCLVPIALAPLLLSGCARAEARTIAVSDDAGLSKAVSSARSGDRITLAPGSYASLAILDRKIEGAPVTLSGKGARIASMSIEGSSGWAFDSLEFGGAAESRNRVILIQGSKDISVRNSFIHGVNVNNDPWDDYTVGIGLRNASRIEIVGNRFRDLGVGFITGSSSDLKFEGNSIAYVREGSNWVATKTGTIRCNRFSHIYPRYDMKEHPDAIQGWWNGDGNNEDMLIEGNVLNLGGPRAVQGYFIAGAWRPKDDPTIGALRNITIRDNIYYGSSRHGISLSGTVDVVIERNTILPSPYALLPERPVRSADGRRSSSLMPRIAISGDASTGRVTGNIAPAFTIPPLMESGNNLSAGPNLWKKIFKNPPEGDDPSDSSFLVDPKSAAGLAGQGARPICGNLLPAPVNAPSGEDPIRATPTAG